MKRRSSQADFAIVCHPPEDVRLRAYHANAYETRPQKTHFARNRDIVNETDLLIACPCYTTPITPETRGGTAYTVNYARKQGKRIFIVWADGTITEEPEK